jgi:hypothetical protein
MTSNNKTSLLVTSQLPEYVRDSPEYANFTLFLKAYYEWMEQEGQVTNRSKNLLSYKDIDTTTDEFLNYFVNDFLPNFPQDTLLSKQESIKVARQLYQSKGTPASYQLLFRILFNSDFDVFYTKDAVLKASSGEWYVTKSLKVAGGVIFIKSVQHTGNNITLETFFPHGVSANGTITVSGLTADTYPPNGKYTVNTIPSPTTLTYTHSQNPTGTINANNATLFVSGGIIDPNFLKIQNLRVFGETTKSIAVVENTVLSGTKVEIFISNIERLFQSGEYIRVVDKNNQTVLFNGYPLRGKIVGQVSQLNIDPKNRGLLYQPGDPVIVDGGLEYSTGVGAKGQIAVTTAGAITSANVVTGGYGYTTSSIINVTKAPGAIIIIPSIDLGGYNPVGVANVSIPINSIALKQYLTIGNSTMNMAAANLANAFLSTANSVNLTLANAFTFLSFSTYPISSVQIKNGGGGITEVPQLFAESLYTLDNYNTADLAGLGILAPIQIINGGNGYQANDKIVFTGGTGFGASANVITVSGNGAITSVSYVYGPSFNYPLGGTGYTRTTLPTLSVVSANGANASLQVPGILGDGASFSVSVDRAGSITTINLTQPGEDYISTPNVSFKIQDILVANVSISNPPVKDDVVYQGANTNTATYIAKVDSVRLLRSDANPTLSNYNLRVFDYNFTPNTALPLNIANKNIHMIPAGSSAPFSGNVSTYLAADGKVYTRAYNSSGIITYGDGNAKGTAQFLNGLVIGQGQYLNTKGQPSSFDVLQSDVYNNYTYQITVSKEIAKYRDVLLNLLHPTGMKVIGRFAMNSNNHVNFHGVEAVNQGKTLQNYTGYPASSVSMVTDFVNGSNNVIQFNNLANANLASFVFGNSSIQIIPINGPDIHAEVQSIDSVANTVTLKTSTWLTFGNVAYVSAQTTSNIINILSVTKNYDIVNNGNYSNTSYPIKDIVFAGDKILIGSNTSNTRTVTSVDWVGGKIYLSSNANITTSNTFMAVNRTLSAQTNVTIFGPLGTQYVPQLITEDGRLLTTEDGNIILLG